jgi:hypothetical protein
MLLELPDVTLVAVDSVAHALTRLALEDTLRQIRPAKTIVLSDRHEAVPVGAGWVQCEAMLSVEAFAGMLWYQVPHFVNTSHFLLVQWDGWALDAQCWNPQFLHYDYIGAPWGWFRDGLNVGNGGFSLRSLRLCKFLAAHTQEFPIRIPEDYALCRVYRPVLERLGLRWAPDAIAGQFAFERTRPVAQTFGFHGPFNWTTVLSADALAERMALATDWVRGRF